MIEFLRPRFADFTVIEQEAFNTPTKEERVAPPTQLQKRSTPLPVNKNEDNNARLMRKMYDQQYISEIDRMDLTDDGDTVESYIVPQ